MGRSCSTHGTEEDSISYSRGETGKKEKARRPRGKWDDNIKIDLRERAL
jgi:DNA-nicking Smr family endonuclease